MSDFVTTRWSVVLAAGRQGLDHDRAMSGLCQDCWLPLYGYARRRGRGPEEARDFTEKFFACLLEKALEEKFRSVLGSSIMTRSCACPWPPPSVFRANARRR